MDGTRWVARTSFASALLSALGATTCCTLPTVLGALGLGGAVASAATAIPAPAFLSAHRVWLFVVTGILLTVSRAAMAGEFERRWLPTVGCPSNGAQRQSHALWWVSVTIYVLTVAITYLGAPLARLMGVDP